MKFAADAMLGRLARWMRLLGFDTLYFSKIDDARLLRVSRAEGRVLLTRDSHFRGREGCLLVESEDPRGQLMEVVRAFGQPPGGESRCLKCNGEVKPVRSREEVEGLVPEHVWRTQGGFGKCASCGKVYWEGSHYERFRAMLDEALRETRGLR